MVESKRVASVNDVPPGKSIVVEVNRKKIALFNINGSFYALDNTCTHRGGPLGEGSLHGTTVNCPWHGAQFDVTSGQVLGPPASIGVTSYPTKVEEGGVWVTLA